MPKQEQSLSRKQEAALAALLSQPTIPLAAAQAGVGLRTLTRWLAEDETFKGEYRALQREIVNNAVYQLVKASNNAVNTLISVMNEAEAPASARVSAAKVVLEMAYRGIEMEDLSARIEALETQFNPNGHKR